MSDDISIGTTGWDALEVARTSYELPLGVEQLISAGQDEIERLRAALAKREAVAEGFVMVPQSWVDTATKAKQLTPDVCRAYPGAASAHITGLANLILQLAASQQAAKGEGT